eukprot:31362-Pelagococcus_subviridis.AAC.11
MTGTTSRNVASSFSSGIGGTYSAGRVAISAASRAMSSSDFSTSIASDSAARSLRHFVARCHPEASRFQTFTRASATRASSVTASAVSAKDSSHALRVDRRQVESKGVRYEVERGVAACRDRTRINDVHNANAGWDAPQRRLPRASRHADGDGVAPVAAVFADALVHRVCDVLREIQARSRRGLRAASALLLRRAHVAAFDRASRRRGGFDLRERQRDGLHLRERPRDVRLDRGSDAPPVASRAERVDGVLHGLELVVSPRVGAELFFRVVRGSLLLLLGRALGAARLSVALLGVVLGAVEIVVVAAAPPPNLLPDHPRGAFLVRLEVHLIPFPRAEREVRERVVVRRLLLRLADRVRKHLLPKLLRVHDGVAAVRGHRERRGAERVPSPVPDRPVLRARAQDLIDVLVGKRRGFFAARVAKRAVDAVLQELVDLLRVLLAAALAVRRAVVVDVAAAAEDSLVEAVLLRARLEERLLVRRLGDESVDFHLLRLTDAMAPRHRLEVVLRVPVRVVDDRGVRGGQRDPHPARASGQEIHESLAVLVEPIDPGLAIRLARAPVEAFVLVLHHPEVVLQDVQHDRELREDENLLPLGLELREELRDEDHLSGGAGEEIER